MLAEVIVASTEVQVLLLISSLLCLIGLDCKISMTRWTKGYRDLNPIVQHFVKTTTPVGGVLALCVINLLVIAAASFYLPLLWMLLGGKLALASLQIRSLLETNK